MVLVVSQPDRPRGRGRKRSPAPVAELALRAGVPLLRPEHVAAPDVESALRAASPDLGVVVAFGQFLPKRIRELPRLGYTINGHASLLPRWRGAAPIARAVLAGDRETGISVMRVEREMDAGPIASSVATAIRPDESAGELEERLAGIAAGALAAAIDEISLGRITWTPQPTVGVTLAPKLARDEARLDFTEPAEALVRRVRAFAPKPGAFMTLRGEPLRVLRATTASGAADRAPGTVVRGRDPLLRIATGDGWLVPLVLQRAGGRALATADFLRGHEIDDGIQVGSGVTTARLPS